jgi:branched-chain amino acid transport system substrate-binding protein
MKVRYAAAAIAAVAAMSLLAGCSSGGGSGDSTGGKTLTIGTVGAFSGANASTGDANKAVIAYFDNLDASGGIDGYKINVVQGDDQYNAALTPGVVRKLIPQVQGFCGNNGTDENVAAQPILAQAKIPNIAPATGASSLVNPVTDTQYLVVPDYGRLTTGLLQYAVKTLHKSRIAVMYIDGSTGAPVIDAAKSEAKKLGVTLVDTEPYAVTATTLAPQIQKVKAANPDFVLDEAVTSGFALAVNQAQQVGLDTTWGGFFFGGTPQFAQLTNNATSGKTYIAGFVNAPSDPSTEKAMKIVNKKYSSIDVSDAQAMQGWTLADACAAVIKKTIDDGKTPTAANLIATMRSFTLDDDYVHGLKWTTSSHSGVTKFQVLKQDGADFNPVTDFIETPTY